MTHVENGVLICARRNVDPADLNGDAEDLWMPKDRLVRQEGFSSRAERLCVR